MKVGLHTFGCLVFFLGCAADATNDSPSAPSLATASSSLERLPQGDPTFDDILALLASGEVRSIEDFLSWLPESYLSRFTLFFESHSPMQASYLAPKVIVFGDTFRLVMTFNADARQRMGDRVEIMHAPVGQRYELRDIQFPSEHNGLTDVVVSDPNPATCTGCHGTNVRPLFAEYPDWPGAYGHAENLLFEGSQEYSFFREWKAARNSHPRYRALLIEDESVGGPAAPYYLGGGEERISRINTLLTRGLAANHLMGLAKQWQPTQRLDGLVSTAAYVGICRSSIVPYFTGDDSISPDALVAVLKPRFKEVFQNHPELLDEQRAIEPALDATPREAMFYYTYALLSDDRKN